MSLYRKLKQGKFSSVFAGDTYAHFSRKRYRIYHDRLQKKDFAYSVDSIFVDMSKKADDDDANIKEIGINKSYFLVDDSEGIDGYKD